MQFPLILVTLLGCPKPAEVAAADAGGGNSGAAELLGEKPTADGLVESQVDLNGDKKADIFDYYRERTGAGRLLVRKDTDLNGDGKIDVQTSFDDAGLRVEERMDGDFDGRVDWVDHYLDGARAYSEVDTNFDGAFDTWKYLEGGKIRRIERDTNADGRVDLWQYLDEGGSVSKIGRDLDRDGKMDPVNP